MSGGNTFSGVQKFYDKVNIVSNDGLYVSGTAQVTNLIITVGQILYPVSESVTYEHKLPYKSGTFALTSDLPVANNGTGTTALTSLKIGDTIYSIPSGGAGGVTSVTTSGTGNAVTGASISGNTLTLTKGSTFLTSHQSLANCAKLTDQNIFNVRQITLGYWQAGKDGGPHIIYGSSEIEYTYKSGIISNSYTTHTLSFPKKTGTIALTSDIPSTSGFVTTNTDQTITGIKTFTSGSINVSKTDSSNKTMKVTYGCNAIAYTEYGATRSNLISFPAKDGTFALTSDIPIKTATLSGTTLTLTI